MGHVLHDGTTASGPERIANLTASGDRSSFAADRAISRSQRPGPSGAGRRLSRLSGKVFLAVVRNRRSLQWVTGRQGVVRAVPPIGADIYSMSVRTGSVHTWLFGAARTGGPRLRIPRSRAARPAPGLENSLVHASLPAQRHGVTRPPRGLDSRPVVPAIYPADARAARASSQSRVAECQAKPGTPNGDCGAHRAGRSRPWCSSGCKSSSPAR